MSLQSEALQWHEYFFQTRWLNFEKVINALLSKEVHHLNIKELQSYAKEKCFIDDDEEFTTMVNFYHDLGIIIKHYSTVILSAKWLIDLFGQLITIPDFNKMVRIFVGTCLNCCKGFFFHNGRHFFNLFFNLFSLGPQGFQALEGGWRKWCPQHRTSWSCVFQISS